MDMWSSIYRLEDSNKSHEPCFKYTLYMFTQAAVVILHITDTHHDLGCDYISYSSVLQFQNLCFNDSTI
jgi:hypothetical protein